LGLITWPAGLGLVTERLAVCGAAGAACCPAAAGGCPVSAGSGIAAGGCELVAGGCCSCESVAGGVGRGGAVCANAGARNNTHNRTFIRDVSPGQRFCKWIAARYRNWSSTSRSQSGRFSTSRGLLPSGGPMMPSRCIMSRMRAARP